VKKFSKKIVCSEQLLIFIFLVLTHVGLVWSKFFVWKQVRLNEALEHFEITKILFLLSRAIFK